MSFATLALLQLLTSFLGLEALHWSQQPQNHTVIQVCEGDNFTFPWLFSVGSGEVLENIKWLYSKDGAAPDLVANYIYGHFIAVPSFEQQMRHVDSGSVLLNQVTAQDSGHYSVEVSLHTGDQFTIVHRNLQLQVAEPPARGQDQLTVSGADHAVYDPTTDQFYIQLACGHLSSLGKPPAAVEWTTPTGTDVDSSFSANGTSYLRLTSRIQGGNYSCRLSPQSDSVRCLASDVPLKRSTSVAVDAVAARMALLEARTEVLREENKHLQHQLNETRTTLTDENNQLKLQLNKTRQWLELENQMLQQKLETTNGTLEGANDHLRIELHLAEKLLNTLGQQMLTLQTELNQTYSDLKGRLDGLGSKLPPCQDKSGNPVSFHAKLSSLKRLDANARLVFDRVITNQGNAYNHSSGVFTAPVNGSYFFTVTTTPSDVGKYSECQLLMEGHEVARVSTRYRNYSNMATAHAALVLQQGQRVWVASSALNQQFADNLSLFTGFLISPSC